MACVTGNATALSMSPALTATLVALGDITETGVVIDDNDLVSGTLDKKCAGDLITHEPLEFTVKYLDADAGDLDTHPVYTPITSLVLTFSSLDTITCASGFISSRTVVGFDNNNRVLVTYTFQPTIAYVYNVVV